MPSTCIIRDCKTKYATDVSFHRFPVNNSKLLKQWIRFANRGKTWTPTRWTCICSSHFKKSDYQEKTNQRKILKKFAIPSVHETSNDDMAFNGSNDSVYSPSQQYHHDIDFMCHFCGQSQALGGGGINNNEKEKSHLFNFSKLNFSHFNSILKQYPYINLNESAESGGGLIKICDKCYSAIANFEVFLVNFLKLYNGGVELQPIELVEPLPVESPEFGAHDLYMDTSKLNKMKIKQEPVTVIKEEILEPGQRFIPSELLIGQSLSNNDVIEVTPPNDIINIIEEDNNENQIEIHEEFDFELKSEEVKIEIIDVCRPNDEHVRHDHTYAKCIDLRYDGYEYSDDQKPIFLDQITCTLCNSYFEDQTQLEKHTSIFHTFHTQTCNECYMEFKTLYDYLIHKNDTHGKINVDENVEDSEQPIVVYETIPTEIDQVKIPCELCGEELATKKSLNHHKKYLCKFKMQYCKVCKIGFEDVNIFKMHKCYKKVMALKCSSLLRNKPAKLNFLKNGRYTCKFCSRNYGKYYNLLKHIRLHRPIQEWNLKCGNCGMLFDRVYDLNQHCRKSICTINPKEPVAAVKINYNSPAFKRQKLKYVCLKCNKILSSSKSLKMHEYIHSATKPFVCETCGKKFRSPLNLRQHKKSHIDLKSFSCNSCDKTFKWKSNLQLHVNSFHLNIKPHACPQCNYRYATRRNMLACKHSVRLMNKF